MQDDISSHVVVVQCECSAILGAITTKEMVEAPRSAILDVCWNWYLDHIFTNNGKIVENWIFVQCDM